MKVREETRKFNFYAVAYVRQDKRYLIHINRTFLWLTIDPFTKNSFNISITTKEIRLLDREVNKRKNKN